ncbi:MAG: peptide chain release factor N(5)-glutamine methyltransferase [Alistipes sp.]
MSTRRQIVRSVAASLETLYGEREARQIALLAVAELAGLRTTDLLVDPDQLLDVDGLEHIVTELSAGRPLQYVLGSTDFCDLRIGVREGVLIPRPETEELVQWVVRENAAATQLLDIGTGSGCIALALKCQLPQATVLATDLSEDALTVARENATALNLAVEFRRADALHDLTTVFPESFDAIVSNPPYIPQNERSAMRCNVTDYEPMEALFVPDDDPLLFYRSIAHAAHQMLTLGGRIYYEIHENFSREVCNLLRTEGFSEVQLRNDFNDKPRMVCGRKRA